MIFLMHNHEPKHSGTVLETSKSQEQCCEAAGTAGGASSHTPPPLVARGFTRRRKNTRKQAGLAQLLLFLAGDDLKSRIEHPQQLILLHFCPNLF